MSTRQPQDGPKREVSISCSADLLARKQFEYALNPQRLGDILLEMGVLADSLQALAADPPKQDGERIGEYFRRKGLASVEEIYRALAQQFGIPFVHLRQFDVDASVLTAFPPLLARKYSVVPLADDGHRLIVAVSNPADRELVATLRFLSAKTIELALATPGDIAFAISNWYGQQDIESAMETLDIRVPKPDSEPSEHEAEAISRQRPVVQLVHHMLTDAVNQRASDIHVRPRLHGVDILFRVDGVLRKLRSFDKSLLPAVVGRIKIIGGMNIAERRLPQDGRSRVHHAGKDVDLRLSVIPGIYGESVVIRLLDTEFAMGDLQDLGFEGNDAHRINHLLSRSNGIFLVTGPTGSGKSTTLYTALGRVRQQNLNIITVEDPVEYHVDGITQIQVNHQTGYTFARALRHILRHDPDVIMVGEIRDQETAKMAVESALTGHLVLSTLHTNDAATSVTRLLEIGVEPYLLNSALLGVLAQRLVRRNCPHCLTEEVVEPEVRRVLGVGDEASFYFGAGCESCRYTGIAGRLAVYELLEVTPAMKDLLVADASASRIADQAERDGMTRLTQHALTLAERKLISLREVYRVRLQ